MLICLHIGAHGTASDYIQARLHDGREAIQRRKLRVLTHGWTRSFVTQRLDELGDAGRSERKLAETLASMIETHSVRHRLVLSDENIAGPIAGPAGLYPDVAERLTAIRDAFPRGHHIEALFCIRDYAGLFDGLFARRTGHPRPYDLQTFREIALNPKRGWRDVVAEIQDIVGADRTTVWTYDAFVRDPDQIAGALLGDATPKVFEGFDRAAFSPLTKRGVSVLRRASDLLNVSEHERLASALRRFRFEPPDEVFSLFSQIEKVELARRYANDIEQIGRMGCRLIESEAADKATT